MKILLTTSLILLFNACSTPHIENNDNTLAISMHDKDIIKADGKLIYESRVDLLNIDVEQKVYIMDNGSILTYEYASVSTGYIYSYGMNRTVGILFPQYNYDLIDTKGNIHFFKLYNKEEVIYMILENMNKKRIKMVYGLSKNTFDSLFNTLVNEKELVINRESLKQTFLLDKSTYIKSRWSNKNIILDTIITKMGGRLRIGM